MDLIVAGTEAAVNIAGTLGLGEIGTGAKLIKAGAELTPTFIDTATNVAKNAAKVAPTAFASGAAGEAATEATGEPGTLRMLARSSYFKVLINDDIIETDKPIQLEQGMSIMNSTAGGTFNNVDQSMVLSGQVKGRIERLPQGVQ